MPVTLIICRGSKLSSCPPIVLSAILKGWSGSPVAALTDGSTQHTNGYANGSASEGAGSHSQLVARLDANQEAIESGNALLVNDQGPALVGGHWLRHLTLLIQTTGALLRPRLPNTELSIGSHYIQFHPSPLLGAMSAKGVTWTLHPLEK
jgi:hypothetical protein